ncbi:nuclear cap-binding protein subunit 2-like [Phyllostomus discolor]|uniref:Nuclear cap-binding protein subunit 2 n=1 Tax=Phyllostomus discolor TaxID=89673 RepID=A0A7E6CZ63_9CHIR|nr:nuclear cap-binding protein subunit 2-like [Phyllostomus discolor]
MSECPCCGTRPLRRRSLGGCHPTESCHMEKYRGSPVSPVAAIPLGLDSKAQPEAIKMPEGPSSPLVKMEYLKKQAIPPSSSSQGSATFRWLIAPGVAVSRSTPLHCVLRALCSDSSLELSQYQDQHFLGRGGGGGGTDNEEQEKLLEESCTSYVGNLSFDTTEEQIDEFFGKHGDIKRITVGLDGMKKTARGLCFVAHRSRADAENALRYRNGARLGDQIVRPGGTPAALRRAGSRPGCGRSGGQVRGEPRQDYDAGRRGYGE